MEKIEKDGKMKKDGKKCFLPPLPFKISLRGTSFYISLNSLVFYLSRMFVEFSLTCIFQHMWEKLLIYGVPIPRKSMNLSFFAHAPVPHSKLRVEIFENLFAPRQEGWEEAMICSIKTEPENTKMTWNISSFPLGMIAIFLNVMGLATILLIISD